MKTLLGSLLTIVLLVIPAALSAQTESWAQHVDEDDVQAVGYVVKVEDDRFDLRTHSDGVMTFPIPQDRDYSADLQIGNRVQVFYDQDLFASGSPSITFMETYSGPIAEGDGTEGDNARNLAVERDGAVGTDTETALEAEAKEAMNEAESEIAEAGDEVEEAWDETREEAQQAWNETEQEAREFGNEVEAAAENDDAGEREANYQNQTYSRDTLPQTASSLPLMLAAGSLLTLLGAVALRSAR